MTKLTVESVARYFKVSKPTVRNHIKNGTLSVVESAAGKREIEFSEAQRVYELSEEGKEKFSDKKAEGGSRAPGDEGEDGKAIINELRARITGLEGSLENREEDIEFLKGLVEKRDDEMAKVLTDQRSDDTKAAERAVRENQRFEEIEKRFEDREEKNAEQLAKAKAWMARQVAESRRLAEESRKPWWEKMGIFGSKRVEVKLTKNRDLSARRSV